MARLGGAVTLASLILATTSFAYVLPQGSILRRLSEARDELRLTTLKVEGSTSFSNQALKNASAALGAPAQHGELRAEAVFSMRTPGRCRLELSRPDGKSLAFVVAGGKQKGPEGLPSVAVALQEACAIFGARGASPAETRAQIEAHLRSIGVEQRRSSLGRFGGHIAYVLGDPAEGRPQLWIYKDSFRPARVRFTDKAGTAWDVRFLDYSSPSTGDWFPRTLEVWTGQDRQLRLTALEGTNQEKLPDALFQ